MCVWVCGCVCVRERVCDCVCVFKITVEDGVPDGLEGVCVCVWKGG